MTADERAKLKRLAEGATKGPWGHLLCGDDADGWIRDSAGNFMTTGYEGEMSAVNVRYIAAANPAAVLDLLAERDALFLEVKRLMGVIAKADRDLECGATRSEVEADLSEALGEGS